MTFRQFLKERSDEQSPIGDLARDAFADTEWTGADAESLREQLDQQHACEGAMEAFGEAQRQFERSAPAD